MMNVIVVCQVFIVVAQLVSVGATSTSPITLQLHTLTNPLAVCNDGSPAGFYYRPSLSPSSSNYWIIQQQGGDWCYDNVTCSQLAMYAPSLVSSKTWKSSIQFDDGVFNSSHPLLRGAHLVYIRYCTSDGYIGNTSQPNSFGFVFRGRQVVHSVFETLLDSYGLGSVENTTILYSGCSAGSRGVIFNADYVDEMLLHIRKNITFYGALIDSGLWLDREPINPNTTMSFMQQTKRVFEVANVVATVSPNCLQKYPQGWQCIFPQYAIQLLRTPMLVYSYLFDEFQLSYDIGVPYGDPLPLTNASVHRYTWNFRKVTATVGPDVVVAGATGSKGLFPACFNHCATENVRYRQTSVGGVSLDTAVTSWVFRTSDVPQNVVDTCSGFDCGVDCDVE
eukprot:PhF_6_TR525/c0_g1_i1/m.341/K19882/NOTUM; O-palmitoleoyl-L-serine hydrolase